MGLKFGGGRELSSTVNNKILELFGTLTQTVATGAAGATEVVARSAARSPLPHAPGARMTVVYINSLKLSFNILASYDNVLVRYFIRSY